MATECSAAARVLRERRAVIIDAFVTACRAELPAARALDREAVVDSLPDVLENVAVMLVHGETAPDLDESSRLGAAHGRVRATQPGFRLDDLAIEYRILDRVVCAALREAGDLARDVEDTLRDAIYRGLGSAASELVRARREVEAAHLADRERMLEELQASRALLESSVARLHAERELRERFVAALTHDLRTPLSAARMGADLLARITEDPARVQRLAGRIADNIDRADGMIRDLLDASTLRAGETLPVERSACNLTALVRQTLDELASIHGERFVLRAPSAVEGAWDCAGVRRLVENLCANAVKYGAAHRPITVTVGGDDGAATLEVHNEGEPIDPAALATLFEPFRRAAAARTSGRVGWGLGLALVKGIAEAHGGSARVTSTRETGTVFTVVLPR